MIKDMGNVKLFELFETESKSNEKKICYTENQALSIAHADIS